MECTEWLEKKVKHVKNLLVLGHEGRRNIHAWLPWKKEVKIQRDDSPSQNPRKEGEDWLLVGKPWFLGKERAKHSGGGSFSN